MAEIIVTGTATLISGVAKIGLTLYGFSTSGIAVGSSAAAA